MRFGAARARPERIDASGGLYYYDKAVGSQAAKVLPGEYLVTRRDIALVTLLGSCVAACLRDPLADIGGINHFMLPEGGAGPASESARYGGYAMEMLVNELLKRGASRGRLEAKVFGGGSVLQGFVTANVGERNAQFVREYLAREGIRIVAEDLLDVHPRKLYYFPHTGRALVRRLPAAYQAEVGQLERRYRRRLRARPVDAGGIELFA